MLFINDIYTGHDGIKMKTHVFKIALFGWLHIVKKIIVLLIFGME